MIMTMMMMTLDWRCSANSTASSPLSAAGRWCSYLRPTWLRASHTLLYITNCTYFNLHTLPDWGPYILYFTLLFFYFTYFTWLRALHTLLYFTLFFLLCILYLIEGLTYFTLRVAIVLFLLANLQNDITAVLRDNRAAANILSNMMEGLLD